MRCWFNLKTRNKAGKAIVAVVQIQGYTFWLNFLPPVWRARILAESVRRSYGGRFPWGSAQMLGAAEQKPGWELQMQLPDGQCWNLRPAGETAVAVEFDKHAVRHFVERHWLRSIPGLVAASTLIDWLRDWVNEWRIATGRTRRPHWAVESVTLHRLPSA